MQQIKNTISILLLIFLATACHLDKSAQNENPRQKTNFGQDWEFKKTIGDDGTFTAWEKATLPHAVNIEPLVIEKQWQGEAIYRKEFEVPDWKNKKVFLYFEGVMHEAEVSVNGKKATHHIGGYLPFTVDISGFLKKGINTIEVKTNNLDNQEIPPGKPLAGLDFNFYGGIYRNVYLITTNKLYITDPVAAGEPGGGGVLVHFENISESSADGILKVQVQNDFEEPKTIYIEAAFSNPEGFEKITKSNKLVLNPRENAELSTTFSVDNPNLWSPENPQLYNLQIKVFGNGEFLDIKDERVGVRKIELTENGFFLNGEKGYLRGTNRHQEYPYVGYALSDESQWRDAVEIKNAGFDFVRLSHYPHAEAFMEACDELGLMTMNCIPGWQFIGDSIFIENSYQDCRDLIRRDRNHPSIVFWELSLNESGMTDDYMETVNKILDEELPFDDAYSCGWIDHPSYDLFIPARQHGQPPDYWNFYKDGLRPVCIAEYGDWEYYAQNAGFNQTEFADLKTEERTSRQLREDGETRLLQQALNFQEARNSNLKGTGTIGDANWLMFDYNRGYSPDLESSGISSIFRLPKIAYYFYQSQQGPQVLPIAKIQSGPMVKITNYWTENSTLDIKVYSNCEEVELFLNGEAVAKQKATPDVYSSYLDFPPFIFKLKNFEPGTLLANAHINGKVVVSDAIKTPGEAAAIKLEVDLSEIPINTEFQDVVFVYASIVDENGTLVPDADLLVHFILDGDAELIGDNPAQAKAGIATILLRTSGLKEPIKISASTMGIEGGEIVLK